jgi:hypothetical protein
MFLCEDWSVDVVPAQRLTIQGLITGIHSLEDPPFPLLYEEICVFLLLMNGRGKGKAHIVCVDEDSDQRVFRTATRTIEFEPDPLEVVGVPFRIRNFLFPFPGVYLVQFWYDGELLVELPLRLR